MGKPMIHPNRFAGAGDERASMYRVVKKVRQVRGRDYPCVARVAWRVAAAGDPAEWAAFDRDERGRLMFDGNSWSAVTGSAVMFARLSDPDAPHFGAKYPEDNGYWRWWDGTTTSDNILAREDAADYVREWLQHVFPAAADRIDVFER